ncbi:MAG: dihydrofolate reductase [Bacteroidales bacterium]
MVSIIVAMGRNRVIGRDNSLVWHLPADLKHFRDTTMGKPVIMGRKTYESMGAPLPGRTNIVVSRKENYRVPDCLVAGSLEEALELAGDVQEVFIAGGGEIYRQAIPLADRMYITVIDHDFAGDTRFPEFPEREWKITDRRRHEADHRNKHAMEFLTYEKN